MKKNRFKILTVACVVGANLMFSSCVDNLLNQTPGGEQASSLYWKTESDAEYAVNGVYSQARAMFNRDYVFDGNTEYLRFRGNVGTSQATGDRSIAYRNGSYNNPSTTYGSSFDNYYQYAYATVNRANYAIQNIEKMLPDAKTEESKAKLEAFIGEAKMLRGMAYFRLISMWGDVPYFDKIIESNDEVANISRTSITEIKQHIYDDFTYAWEKLPAKPVALGRFTKWGALAFRGKLQLFWACWNRTSWPWDTPVSPNGGWPELDTFTPNASESAQAYKDAAADFKKVIEESGINLFRSGEPGDWGEMGGCEVLPNYFYLFLPTANTDPELMSVLHMVEPEPDRVKN